MFVSPARWQIVFTASLFLSLFFICNLSSNKLVGQENALVITMTEADVDEVTLNDRLADMPWMKHIDSFFEQYLVVPVATVLMADISFGAFQNETVPGSGVFTGPKIPFVVTWLFVAGCFLTLRMGFINIRAFAHAIQLVRGKYDDPSEPGEVSHFQALSSALSATVGLGNIGGVALAIGLGGPGATFWMIVIGLLGMTSKFAECTLGVMFRSVDADGEVLGGPMRYLDVGLKSMGIPVVGTVLSVVFAVLCVGASFGGGNAYQIGQSLGVLQQADELEFLRSMPYLYGLLMAAAVGLVIVGGIKSIGSVAGKVVPLMCLAYMLVTFYIIASHYDMLPNAIWRIVSEAFTPRSAIVGGAISVMIYGIQRAVFSNEAGVGSAAIAHAAAKTDEPVSEGIVALLEPFIDTVIVCSFTALTIVITGVFETPEGQQFAQASNGAALTRLAFIEGGHEWFAYLLYVCVVLFAFSTCISWSYYGERSFVKLFGESSSVIYKILFLIFTVLGSIISKGNILDFSDLMILAMSVPNLIGVYLMSGLIRRSLDEYWRKYKSGELEPVIKYDS